MLHHYALHRPLNRTLFNIPFLFNFGSTIDICGCHFLCMCIDMSTCNFRHTSSKAKHRTYSIHVDSSFLQMYPYYRYRQYNKSIGLLESISVRSGLLSITSSTKTQNDHVADSVLPVPGITCTCGAYLVLFSKQNTD